MTEDYISYFNRIHSRNQIIVKGDLGKASPPTHKLPGQEFAYGSKVIHDHFDARYLMTHWIEHTPSPRQAQALNFRKLNEIGLKEQCVTPKEQRVFRLKRKSSQKSKSITEKRLKLPDITYGRTKPSVDVPIEKLLTNSFGRSEKVWVESETEKSPSVIRSNKSYEIMRAFKDRKAENKPDFKMKRFLRVKSVLKSHKNN